MSCSVAISNVTDAGSKFAKFVNNFKLYDSLRSEPQMPKIFIVCPIPRCNIWLIGLCKVVCDNDFTTLDHVTHRVFCPIVKKLVNIGTIGYDEVSQMSPSNAANIVTA